MVELIVLFGFCCYLIICFKLHWFIVCVGIVWLFVNLCCGYWLFRLGLFTWFDCCCLGLTCFVFLWIWFILCFYWCYVCWVWFGCCCSPVVLLLFILLRYLVWMVSRLIFWLFCLVFGCVGVVSGWLCLGLVFVFDCSVILVVDLWCLLFSLGLLVPFVLFCIVACVCFGLIYWISWLLFFVFTWLLSCFWIV